jgi:acetamidase/formamidase
VASAQVDVAAIHYLEGAHHTKWDNSLEPALVVAPEDIVVVKCREATDGQFTPDSTVEALDTLDFDKIHTLSGPIAVAGAEPGDLIEIEMLDFEHEGWAWTMVHPGLGLLHEEFGDARALWIWKTGDDDRAEFKRGIRVPVEPFCGVVGLAPSEPGARFTLPPSRVGGNLDIRHLTKGSVLSLPVEVPNGLLSIGDCHLAQGDGEICGTALEAPMTVTIRVGLRKNKQVRAPFFTTSGPTTSKSDGMGYHVTTAIGLDMQEGAREAVRAMIDYLADERGLSRLEAYILCSAAGDLKMAVPVLADGHRSVVSFHLPKSIFVG